MDTHKVEIYIGYNFREPSLLAQALGPSCNKRLGFLGDAVIDLILLDGWYRTNKSCLCGTQDLQYYGSNRIMASEAHQAHFEQVNGPGQFHHGQLSMHQLATEVEAVIAAVWLDSDRNWDVTAGCYHRIKAATKKKP
ncbi:hypothetical protein BJX64DRAFT_275500 [Aspergillus heterothallicus]